MPFGSNDWEAGRSWDEYLSSVEKHAELWMHHWEHADVDDSTKARLDDLPGRRRVLILTEDWCGDAVRSVPIIVKACHEADGVEVRLLDIAGHEDLMNRHLSKRAKAIPVAIVEDDAGNDLGWWGPRPAPLQALLRDRLRELGSPAKDEIGKFYAPIMGWYKKDGGKTTLAEFALLLERTVG